MNDTIDTLVNAIAAGDALETENAFSAAMAQKVSSKLEDMRMNISQNMFKSSEAETEEYSEE
jgi:thymidine phosphorylase